jgi:hypothetical protein
MPNKQTIAQRKRGNSSGSNSNENQWLEEEENRLLNKINSKKKQTNKENCTHNDKNNNEMTRIS